MKKLSRDEMKKVMGGGTSQALISVNGGGQTVIQGLSSSEASGMEGMVHWCCDSCSSASWAVQTPQP